MTTYTKEQENDKGVAIGYARVSTALQEAEGYSLEAQKNAIERYRAYEGIELLDTFYEVESGRKNDRAVVNEVLNQCELKNAKLVVARLDRFSRDVHFLTTVQKRRVSFFAIDNPSADSMVLQILVSVAENESRIIGTRTKSALAVAKANGVELGSNKTIIATYQRCKDTHPKLWTEYVALRKWYDRYLKKQKEYKNFLKYCEPMYEIFETSHGFTEIIEQSKVGKNHHGDDAYWEEWSKKLGEDWFGQEPYLAYMRERFGLMFWKKPILPTLNGLGHGWSWELTFDKETRKPIDEIEAMLYEMSASNTIAPTQARVDRARGDALKYQPIIKQARAEGHTSIRKLGAYLEENRFKTPNGKATWGVSSVQSLLKVIDDAVNDTPIELGVSETDKHKQKMELMRRQFHASWLRNERDGEIKDGKYKDQTYPEFMEERIKRMGRVSFNTLQSLWISTKKPTEEAENDVAFAKLNHKDKIEFLRQASTYTVQMLEYMSVSVDGEEYSYIDEMIEEGIETFKAETIEALTEKQKDLSNKLP